MKVTSPTSLQLRCGVARDWPDARAVWSVSFRTEEEAENAAEPSVCLRTCVEPSCRLSEDGTLVIWVNVDDHLRLVSPRDDANVAEAFKSISINLQKVSKCSDPHRHFCSLLTHSVWRISGAGKMVIHEIWKKSVVILAHITIRCVVN